ncbi:MAG: hypothetical protein J7J42_03980 [Thermoplasmata archaeon]|nr:hypothetical protein [Thermoplasmata archaeon]
MKGVAIFTISLFFMLALFPALRESTGEPVELRKYGKFLMDHIIREPTKRRYSLIGDIIPLRNSVDNLYPIFIHSQGKGLGMLSYRICINVYVEDLSNNISNVMLDLWMLSWKNDSVIHRQLKYRVEGGYIRNDNRVGLFPFYIVGFENKSKVEKVKRIPYFGFWITDIGGINIRYEKNNVSEEVEIPEMEMYTNRSIKIDVKINGTIYLYYESSLFELRYRWRIPTDIIGILPADVFPLTDDNCTYYLLSSPFNSIYFEYKIRAFGLSIAPTQAYVDMLSNLPSTGYGPHLEVNIERLTLIVFIMAIPVTAAILIRHRRRMA